MRVLLSSTTYPRSRSGWQGVFIGHMVHALARHPQIELSVCAPPGDLPSTVRYTPDPSEARWLAELVDGGGISHALRQPRLSAIAAPAQLLRILARNYRYSDADIYHVNWLQTALPLPADRRPALITVLGNDLKLLQLPGMKALIRRKIATRRAILCPNADWMVRPLENVFGDLSDVRAIPFGIDPLWYGIKRRTFDSAAARWLTVARITRAKLGPLFDWSEHLFKDTGRELHLFGPREEQMPIPSWVHYHGPASPNDLAHRWFPIAKGLITLSRHAEGRPQVMLEAMASGLPIVASRMPAHADLVDHGETGFMCSTQAEYESAIVELQDNEANHRMGEASKALMCAKVGTWDDCAERYFTVYNDLLGAAT